MGKGLYRICVEKDTVFFCNCPDFLNGFNGPDFIVGKHDGNQDGIGPDCLLKFIQLDHPVLIHIQVGDLISPLLQILAGVEDCVVLNPAGNDVLSL